MPCSPLPFDATSSACSTASASRTIPPRPREIAVVVALRDGIPLRDALDRLGVDTAPLDLPPPPEAVPFAHAAPGRAFSWRGHVWTRVTLDEALTATPERRDHPRVVAAYLASTQRGRPATAFRWASGEEVKDPTCIVERVEADEPVTPTDAVGPPLVQSPDLAAWISTVDRWPELGRTVTVDTPTGAITARLLLTDESAGGAAWHMTNGDHLDLDEVSRWHP